MTGKALVPLIDIVFLSLASLLGVMSQMEVVEALNEDVEKDVLRGEVPGQS